MLGMRMRARVRASKRACLTRRALDSADAVELDVDRAAARVPARRWRRAEAGCGAPADRRPAARSARSLVRSLGFVPPAVEP